MGLLLHYFLSMFNFLKRNHIPEIELLPITTDIHSHILPGIDDGAPDVGCDRTGKRNLCIGNS